MTRKSEQLNKSRLGRLLVNRGYISEKQLDEALVLQAKRQVMLGEVLVAEGWITEKELNRTLKQQSRYRYAAAFVAMATAPLQPMMAFAASPALPIQNASAKVSQDAMSKFGGMQMLNDEELAGVNAQGFGMAPSIGMSFGQNADGVAAGFQHKYNRDEEEFEEPDDEQIAYELADTVLTVAGVGPISNFIEADITIQGMKFHEGRSNIELVENGIKFYMPTEIERISMQNIRVKGNSDGPTMGSIYMSNITYHPDSSFTIRAKN